MHRRLLTVVAASAALFAAVPLGSQVRRAGATVAPVARQVIPASGRAGDPVCIPGGGLGGATVVFGEWADRRSAPVVASSDNAVVALVPNGFQAGPNGLAVPVQVNTGAGGTPAGTFTIVGWVNPFTAAAPTVGAPTPGAGPVSGVVCLAGSNLATATATIGGVAAPQVARSAKLLVVRVPALQPGAHLVRVTNDHGSVDAGMFTVAAVASANQPAPTVTPPPTIPRPER
jgi:hypothetical protein